MDELTDEQKAILDFERQLWKYTGAKEAAIRERFDYSLTRYYAKLNHVLDLPAALAYDPLGVKRLIRLRAQRRSKRSTRADG